MVDNTFQLITDRNVCVEIEYGVRYDGDARGNDLWYALDTVCDELTSLGYRRLAGQLQAEAHSFEDNDFAADIIEGCIEQAIDTISSFQTTDGAWFGWQDGSIGWWRNE